jgi:hypothetical protein
VNLVILAIDIYDPRATNTLARPVRFLPLIGTGKFQELCLLVLGTGTNAEAEGAGG